MTSALSKAGAREVIRVGGEHSAARQVIADTRPGEGPLAALEAILGCGRASTYLVCPCDMPALDAALLRRLIAAPRAPVAIFAVDGEEEPRPLPMRVDSGALPTVARLLGQGERSLKSLVRAVQAATVPVSLSEATALRDVDTWEEYRGEGIRT